MRSLRIEIFSRRSLFGKRWFFRVRAKNGEVIAQSEGYQNRFDCRGTAFNLRDNLIAADIIGVEA